MLRIGPWSISALLATLILLFAFQGEAILKQPLVIALLAVPILIQVLFNSALAYWLNRAVGEKHSIACPSALIGTSNFFELAVAVAISLFGFHSGAALATVVGVLVEVPVMLSLVAIINRTQHWFAPQPASELAETRLYKEIGLLRRLDGASSYYLSAAGPLQSSHFWKNCARPIAGSSW